MEPTRTVRTGLYVYRPTTVMIRALNAADLEVPLRRYLPGAPPEVLSDAPRAVGKLTLQPGIYAIFSLDAMIVQGPYVHVESVAEPKDKWPTLQPGVVELARGATEEGILAFFATKGGGD